MELAPWHWVVLIGLAILLFGSKKLPELGKGLGEGFKGFKEGLKGITDSDSTKPTETAHAVTPKPENRVEPVRASAAKPETPVEEPVGK